jgi:endonuclease III
MARKAKSALFQRDDSVWPIGDKMLLVDLAVERFTTQSGHDVKFVENIEANDFLNDLKKYPYAFVLACLMDRGIKAERAWMIPYEVCKLLKTRDIYELAKYSKSDFEMMFSEKSMHRYKNKMGEIFYLGIMDILHKYEGDASQIWNGKPSSATIVMRFLEFKGAGIKISTMAANILARQFKVELSDYNSIDISPDVHIQRVMKRTGLVKSNASIEMIIYKARELNPSFPGIIDSSCWEIGRKWCRPKIPDCKSCPIEIECQKQL